MNIKEGIETYGYLGVLIGTFLEGDIALVLGGLCARCTDLRLVGVILAAFTGAIIGDQVFYKFDAKTNRQATSIYAAARLTRTRPLATLYTN